MYAIRSYYDAFQSAELHRISQRMPLAALPGQGPGAISTALAEKDQWLLQGIAAGRVDLHQFLDQQFRKAQLGVNDGTGNEGAIKFVLDHPVGQPGAGIGEDAQLDAGMRRPHRFQGLRQLTQYDALMRPLRLQSLRPDDTPLLDRRYSYSPVGNIEQIIAEYAPTPIGYGYDAADRLSYNFV